MNNLKLAVRRLLGAPFVTGIAIVSLALSRPIARPASIR